MRKYLYIDGASFESTLTKELAELMPNIGIWDIIDMREIADPYDRVFYYDSYPILGGDKDTYERELIAKRLIFDKINSTDNCHVHNGMLRHRKRSEGGREQKGVDVMLAIQVIQHAYQSNMDEAHIITNDLDFFPIFDALTATKVNSTLIYSPKRAPEDLIHSADVARPITSNIIFKWVRPDLKSMFTFISGGNLYNHTITPQKTITTVDNREWQIGTADLSPTEKGFVIVSNDADRTYYTAKSDLFLERFIYERFGRKDNN